MKRLIQRRINQVLIAFIPFIVTTNYWMLAQLYNKTNKKRRTLASIEAVPQQHTTFESKDRVLIYITTHLSSAHVQYLEQCWPALLSKSSLYRTSDFMMYITEDHDRGVNTTLLKSVFANTNLTVHVQPNPGYNEGAILAMVDAFENHF